MNLYLGIIIALSLLLLLSLFRKPEATPAPVSQPVTPAPDKSAEYEKAREELHKLMLEHGQLQNRFATMSNASQGVMEERDRAREAYDKVTSQKKSGEVRLGHLSEQLIPMLPEFPVPMSTLKFFGNPIDYISIDLEAEMISFIEVKSGGAVLSDKQKKIKKIILDKRVQWFEVRIDDKGVKIK